MSRTVTLEFNPQPKQIEFLLSKSRYTMYGGARGGGKSWSARAKLKLLCMNKPGIQTVLIRRVRSDLYKNHMLDMIKDLEVPGIAKWVDREKAFVFENSKRDGVPSRIYFEFCDSERDIGKFQGPAYDVVCVEEATQFTPDMLDAMRQCNRPSGFCPGFRPRMYFTANPGGPGHAEMKRLFIDETYRESERPEDYTFIQALVYDNKVLVERDPDYVRVLENLPPAKKKAMLYGDWNAYEGQFFELFTDNSEGYRDRKLTHVIKPFEIPISWPRYMAYDYGSKRPYSMHWYAMSNDGRLYCYKEDYGCVEGRPNNGLGLTISQQVERIRKMEEQETLNGIDITRIADPAIFAKDTSRVKEGESIADLFAKDDIMFNRAGNARIPGWRQVEERMRFDDEGKPSLYITTNCRHMIRTIPLMMSDVHRPEDVDTNLEDHAVDELRYMCNTVQLNIESELRNRDSKKIAAVKKRIEEQRNAAPVAIKPMGGYPTNG